MIITNMVSEENDELQQRLEAQLLSLNKEQTAGAIQPDVTQRCLRKENVEHLPDNTSPSIKDQRIHFNTKRLTAHVADIQSHNTI